MRVHRLQSAVTISALFLATAAGRVVAQQAEVRATPTSVSAQGEIGVQKTAVVSAEQQMSQADAISARAGQLGSRLTRMLDEARKDKDILRANCVNRKLTEVNANTRSVEQRRTALKDAAAAGDESRRSHEYTVLTVLAQKLDQLNQEATQCIGQSVYEPGASQVITTVPNDATTVDPFETAPASPPPPTTINPVLASGGM